MRTSRALLVFALANLVLLVVGALGYVRGARLATLPEVSFAVAALVEELALVALALSAVLFTVGRVSSLAQALVGAVLFTLLHAFLFVDVRIFSLFRFHTNGLVVNVVTSPGGLESTHIAAWELGVFATCVAALLVGEALFFRFLQRRLPPIPGAGRRWATFAVAALGVGLAERVSFAAADLADYAPVLRASRAVPFYQWITVKRLLRRHGWLAAREEMPDVGAPPEQSALAYPRAPLRAHVPAERPSILLVVVDSMREDLFAGAMPKLRAFGEHEQYFASHLSGGNSTRFGVFSMFYGLYGAYWHLVLGERRPPIILDRMRELGYRTAALASAPLTSPEFRKTVFAGGADVIVDELPGSPATKDAALVGELERFLAGTDAVTPYFAFVFFDASHSPFDFPAAYARDDAAPVSYLALDDGSAASRRARNRYLSALTYLDDVSARLLDVARAHDPELAHTIVIVTGDHGQEFGEHGFAGHNSAFDPEQIHVPLILHVPGLPPARHTALTSHLDLASTMGEWLGIDSPPADWTQGAPLLPPGPRPPIVSCGWDECGLVDERGVVVFGTESHRSGKFEVRDRDYRELDDARLDPGRLTTLRQVMDGMSAFAR